MNHCQSWVNRNWQQANDHIVLQTKIPNCMWIRQSWKSTAFSGIQIYKPLPHARLQLQYQTHWKENKTNIWRENDMGRKWKAKLHNIHLAKGTSPKFDNVIDLRGVKNGLQKTNMTYLCFWNLIKEKCSICLLKFISLYGTGRFPYCRRSSSLQVKDIGTKVQWHESSDRIYLSFNKINFLMLRNHKSNKRISFRMPCGNKLM